MSCKSDNASVKIPPPLVFVVLIILGYFIGGFSGHWYPESGNLLNGILIAGSAGPGFVLIIASLGLFKRSGQRPEPWTPTPTLIIRGVYRYSRNPMYLGMALIQVAIGLWMKNIWVVLFSPVSLLMVFWLAVLPEESYLQAKFGDDYLAYKRQVRRWL